MKKLYIILTAACFTSTLAFAQLEVTTLTGSGQPGLTGNDLASATFNRPIGMTEDSQGNFYVVENDNHVIRKITPAGVVSIFAGNGQPGRMDGQGDSARFNNPWGITTGAGDTIYVTDSHNHRVCKISPSGYVTTIAGNGTLGAANGPALQATFNYPYGISVAPNGDIFVVDRYNQMVRKISNDTVTTLAGTGSVGFQNGPGNQATFDQPQDCELDTLGNLYVADRDNYVVRKIFPTGEVFTYAGSGLSGTVDGADSVSQFVGPAGLSMDPWGNLYVADHYNDAIRVILSNRQVITVAGANGSGMQNGPADQAQFNAPHGLIYSKQNPDTLYIADGFNHAIRVLNYNAPARLIFASMLSQPTMLTESQAFDVYPNPSKGQFNLSFGKLTGTNTIMEVRDLQGKTVWTKTYDLQTLELPINLENLPSGIYSLSVQSDKSLTTRRIVIN